MFLSLLLVTFVIAFVVSFIVVRIFETPITNILARIIQDEISRAWVQYIKFALYVVGISGGVRIWQIERYVTPDPDRTVPLTLTPDRWVLEIYGTIIGTLQSVAMTLLVFFLFALIAYVIVRAFEMRKMTSLNGESQGAERNSADVRLQ